MGTSFEFGVDVSWLTISPNDEYKAALGALGADAELRFLEYGVHARFMGPTNGKLSPFLGVGLARYNVRDKYESPTLDEDRSSTFPGAHADAGINYWVGRSWGIGITGAYHATFLDDDTFPTRVNSSFYAVTGGLLFKLGSSG
jgi:outer membrane protein W